MRKHAEREPAGHHVEDHVPEESPVRVGEERAYVHSPYLDCRYVEETRECLYRVSKIEQHFRQRPGLNRGIAFVTNVGLGLRQGLVAVLFGSKGDIVVMGRALKEVAVRAAGDFIRLLPPGTGWRTRPPIWLSTGAPRSPRSRRPVPRQLRMCSPSHFQANWQWQILHYPVSLQRGDIASRDWKTKHLVAFDTVVSLPRGSIPSQSRSGGAFSYALRY